MNSVVPSHSGNLNLFSDNIMSRPLQTDVYPGSELAIVRWDGEKLYSTWSYKLTSNEHLQRGHDGFLSQDNDAPPILRITRDLEFQTGLMPSIRRKVPSGDRLGIQYFLIDGCNTLTTRHRSDVSPSTAHFRRFWYSDIRGSRSDQISHRDLIGQRHSMDIHKAANNPSSPTYLCMPHISHMSIDWAISKITVLCHECRNLPQKPARQHGQGRQHQHRWLLHCSSSQIWQTLTRRKKLETCRGL